MNNQQQGKNDAWDYLVSSRLRSLPQTYSGEANHRRKAMSGQQTREHHGPATPNAPRADHPPVEKAITIGLPSTGRERTSSMTRQN
jgi:hypothetical protein